MLFGLHESAPFCGCGRFLLQFLGTVSSCDLRRRPRITDILLRDSAPYLLSKRAEIVIGPFPALLPRPRDSWSSLAARRIRPGVI